MSTESAPDNTAVRVALWRALHAEVDAAPHILDDTIGLSLAAPEPGWQQRGDMDPVATRGFRASIIARTRFVEDLVRDRVAAGIGQYVILGAGLDTFAQRHRDIAEVLQIFEVDQPGTQEWKRRRLHEEGLDGAANLHLVPVDFEADDSWWDALRDSGFAADEPAVVASTGVVMYLTREATAATLAQVAALAPGSVLVLSFLLPPEHVDADERAAMEAVEQAAAESGTPFLGHYTPAEMVEMCLAAGFSTVRHISPDMLTEHFFAHRGDGLLPPSAEHLVLAEV